MSDAERYGRLPRMRSGVPRASMVLFHVSRKSPGTSVTVSSPAWPLRGTGTGPDRARTRRPAPRRRPAFPSSPRARARSPTPSRCGPRRKDLDQPLPGAAVHQEVLAPALLQGESPLPPGGRGCPRANPDSCRGALHGKHRRRERHRQTGAAASHGEQRTGRRSDREPGQSTSAHSVDELVEQREDPGAQLVQHGPREPARGEARRGLPRGSPWSAEPGRGLPQGRRDSTRRSVAITRGRVAAWAPADIANASEEEPGKA